MITGGLSERSMLEKRKLGLVIERRFHEENRWCSATTFHLVEALKADFECVYIQNQKDYEDSLGDIDLLISMEPGWAAPVLKLCRTQVLREELSAIPSYIFYSDPHSNKWREDYFFANGLDYVLSFYWVPFRQHFTRINTSQIVHFPWSIPDHWINESPVIFRGQKKIYCFGGQKSEAYELRNWCRSFDFVESTVNSGVENKVMNESEYINWLRQRDTAIAAGSDSPKYKLTTPKYFEIAAAGSLLFAQRTDDLALLGFEHKRNCIIFDRSDFEQLAKEYLANPETYLQIRQAGRELICQRHLLSKRMNLLAGHVSMVLERKAKRKNLRQSSKSAESSDTARTVLALTDRKYWDLGRKKEFKPYEVRETQFSHILEKYLPENDKFSCVEIGAYPGANLCYLAKRFKYYPVAIEFSKHCDHIEKLLRFNGIERFKVLNQDFFEPVDMKFDVVTSFGFIEHFENYEEVIDRHVQLLKPGGYLVMSCPYLDNFQGNLREFVYTEEKLRQVLSSHNLKVMNLDEIKRVLSKYDMEICLADFIMGNKIWFDPNADYIKPQMKWLVQYLLTINAAGGEQIPSSKLYSPMIMVVARDKSNVRKKTSTPVTIQDVLEQRQWLSREKIEKSQWEDLKSLLAHSYNNVPFYHRRFDELGIRPEDIRNIDDFRKIPVLKKSEIQQNLENMKAGNCPQGQLIRDATGGSTGQPLIFYRDLNAKSWIDAACVRFRRWMGYGPKSKLALIWGADRDVPNSYPTNQRWLNTFNCSERDIEKFVAELVQWKPDAIRAYASSLYMVASYIKSEGLQAPRPKVIESAAEKLWNRQRKVVEDVFGCKVFEMYGSREIPALACECEYHNGMHIFSDLRLIEMIKDGRPAETGEEGSIVITDLVNYGMPFIRYEIGDVGVVSEDSCQCGRGFELLKEIKGRITSTIQTPDGRRIHGEYFTHLFYNVAGIKAFQVHQTRLDEVIVLVQPDKDFDKNLIEQVTAKMRSHLGERVGVKCKLVDNIPSAASGKRHFTISDVPADFAGTNDIALSSTAIVPAEYNQENKKVLFIVDQPGWAHDFKTDNLIRWLGDRFNMIKRYEDSVTADDIAKADLVILYYWKQFNNSNILGLLDELVQNRHKLLIGICSHQEMAHDRDEIIKVMRYLASGIFVNSMLLYHEFSSFFEVPVFYTPNGVDTEFFTPESARASNQKLRVGWAGSITNHGDTRGYHDLILPAISAVEGVELAVAAREDKWRSKDEMLEFYRSIDVYICASAAEGTPNPCLEAAACGVPLLTTRVGNMPELIENGRNGLFIERDVNDIKNKLVLLRDDPALRSKMSEEIIKSIRDWDWSVQAEKYREMFNKTLFPGKKQELKTSTSIPIGRIEHGEANHDISESFVKAKQGANPMLSTKNNWVKAINDDVDLLQQLETQMLWRHGQSLRLHLGCGQKHLDGYINIDYPSSEHNLIQPQADFFADIKRLKFPIGSVDEIRLHHVFEHFSRVIALAMLIKWHSWLKVGGKLCIETPDLIGSAKTLVSDSSWKTKMGVVRHLVGDQTAAWGYHVEQWFPERFRHTLSALGFDLIEMHSSSWTEEPYLSNVEVVAVKAKDISVQELFTTAEQLLLESTVAIDEKPKWEIWRVQLCAALLGDFQPLTSNAQVHDFSAIAKAQAVLSRKCSQLPLEEVVGFNQRARDRWVHEKSKTVVAGSQVLDVGAGTCPYRQFFSHCDYKTQDFKKYHGIKKNNTTEYGQIDYVSDICSIPVDDNSFDVILCTEVMEHVPEPVKALREMVRIVRPGGRLLITAPLGSGLHQLPYHYYGGLSPEWYRHFLDTFGCQLVELIPNGGFFKLLAQECARVSWTLPQHKHLHGDNVEFIQHLFGKWLPRYLFELDENCFIDQFTVGYHVEAVKKHGDLSCPRSKNEQDRRFVITGDT